MNLWTADASFINNITITYCNHCPRNWSLSGSTSTALQHLRSDHVDCLTEAEEHQLFSDNEPTAPGAKTPKRQVKKSYFDMTSNILHDSYRGRKLNKYLCIVGKYLNLCLETNLSKLLRKSLKTEAC